jgi:hypothetical protein
MVTLTLMHDYLCDASSLDISTAETYHWYQAVSSFNRRLSRDAYNHDQVAMMAISAILGTLVFGHIEARTPDKAWPLNPPSASAVTWLRLNHGKQEVWKLVRSRYHNSTAEILGSIHMSQTLIGVPLGSTAFLLSSFAFIILALRQAASITHITPWRWN